MLDDIFDLFSDLVGESTVNPLTGQRVPVNRARKSPGSRGTGSRPQPKPHKHQNKLTARRDRRGGEDPWDWKEEKPPWEF